MERRWLGAALAALAAVLVTLSAPRASAHTIGLSTGEYTAQGASVVARLAFARGEVLALAPAVDADRDGHIAPSEVAASRTLLESRMLARIAVRAGGQPCAARLTDASLTEEDGLLVDGRWDCRSDDQPFEVELQLLDDLARGHRHVARTVTAAGTHDQVLYGAHRTLTLAPAPDGAAAGAPAGEEHESAWAFFKLGIEHIITGYDHLVFIVGLVLARARLRSLLTIVTAFTLAHSITLGLAALDVWTPSARIVEPAIALSIAYVGIENFFVKDASKRWRITFPFGLVHGFGFAGALRELALPSKSIPTALVSFNLGVEAGQLAVLAVLLPVLLVLRSQAWFEPRGVRVLSGAVAIAGGLWFVSRVISG